MDNVVMYTDGSCIGNPGPGGYAAVILLPGEDPVRVSGFDWYTTNNKMELMSVVRGLTYLALERLSSLHTGKMKVTVYSDSTYVCDTLNRASKVKQNFISGTGRKNTEILRELYRLSLRFDTITAVHVKGHGGDPYNEECDRMAKARAKEMQRETDARRTVFREMLADATSTPAGIASSTGLPMDIVEKYRIAFIQHQNGKVLLDRITIG